MNMLSRRNYLVALSIGGVSALAGCNGRQPDQDIDEETEENPIPLPSVLQRDSLPAEILTQHLDTLSTRQFARTIVTEKTENSVRREYTTTDFRQHTTISINSSLVREVYRTREREYVASYQDSEPRYSQKQSQLRSTENWGAQDEITELFNDLSNVSLRGLDKENEVYLYDAQTSPVLDDSNVSVAITVNPIQITKIEVTESRAEQIPRTYRMESGSGDIREPSWISDAEQFSRSVVVGKRQGALFVYNDSSQPIPSESAITIIHPNGNVYTYQLDSTLQSEEILFLEILQSGSVTGLKDSPPDSSVKLVLREEPYYLIGFGPNGEQYFDSSTNTES